MEHKRGPGVLASGRMACFWSSWWPELPGARSSVSNSSLIWPSEFCSQGSIQFDSLASVAISHRMLTPIRSKTWGYQERFWYTSWSSEASCRANGKPSMGQTPKVALHKVGRGSVILFISSIESGLFLSQCASCLCPRHLIMLKPFRPFERKNTMTRCSRSALWRGTQAAQELTWGLILKSICNR